ncbi:MAG TPA: ribonuclease III [Armatimonadota bacterium]|nr:ribonuclease III [Armatimonadota bacterium]
MVFAGNNGKYDELEERLHIHFTDRDLLVQALTHRSYVVEMDGVISNERLEFLGDAVLDLIIGEKLYTDHTDWSEGELTKTKAAVVGERSLEKVARRWDIGPFMRISHGEESSGGRERRALLADAVEAIIGAYYLDHGLEACRVFVLREMEFLLEAIDRHEHERDYKTQLQEVLQARYQAAPKYTVTGESGPPHARIFEVDVVFNGKVFGRGEGRSKKEAEQQAAAEALQSPELTDTAGK